MIEKTDYEKYVEWCRRKELEPLSAAEEEKYERLMFMLGFSTEKSSKVVSEYGFMLDDLDQAKELISRWIKDARQPFNPKK